MASNYDDGDGVWRTIGGRRVFIKNGQSLSEAMIASGKFKNLRKDYKTAKELEKQEKEVLKEEYSFDEIETEMSNAESYEDLYNAVEKIADPEKRNNAKEMLETCEKDGDSVDEAYSITSTEYIDPFRNEENIFKKLPEAKEDYKTANDEWKQLQSKMEKDYNEYGTTNWQDEKKLNELSAKRDIAQSKLSAKEVKDINDEKEILDRYGEDYGYDKDKSNIENLKSQIDYMKIPNESINQTAQRLVEGGDFLIYNGDIKEWLDERGIKYNKDNFFEVYKKEMANKIEKLYYDDNVKQVMTNKDLQKQVAMDVAKSFGAKSVKVNGEEINLESKGNDDFKQWVKDNNVDYNDYEAFVQKRTSLNPNNYNSLESYDKAVREQYLKYHKENKLKNMNDKLRDEAFKKYKKEHPNSKMTLEQFLKKK